MDIKKQVTAISNKLIEEKLPAIIEAQLEEMLKRTVSDIFCEYGDFAKELKEKIQKVIDVNLVKFDLVDYNALIAQTINKELNGNIQTEGLKPIKKLIRSTIGYIEYKEIKLSDIIEKFMEFVVEDSYDNDGEVSIHIIENENHRWHTIGFDIEKNTSVEKCSIEFLVNNNGNMFLFTTKTGWEEKGEVNPVKLTQMNSIERFIYRLYSAQVKVIIDETEYETEWSKYDGY